MFRKNGVTKRVSTEGVRSSNTGFAPFLHPFLHTTLHTPESARYLAVVIEAEGEVVEYRSKE